MRSHGGVVIRWPCGIFWGMKLPSLPPCYSTLSKTRKRLSLEAHEALFGWALSKEADWLHGKTLGVDSATLEANAAMRSIVLRENGMRKL